MGDWKEDALRHKYTPLPEDGPRHKKKAKKRHVRSDHKHEYEQVCIDTHSSVVKRNGKFPAYHVGTRCRVCGRLKSVRLWSLEGHMPSGMPLYEVDFFELARMNVLPEEMRVR